MWRGQSLLAGGAGLVIAISIGATALAQKPGGTLRVHAGDSLPSLSMLEEIDAQPARMTMPIFNNLVMFDQYTKQNSTASIVPDLATGWNWSEDGTALTFPLRQGVKWHDGKPLTAQDVKCTWDMLLGKSSEKPRLNPRKAWYRNLTEVTTNGNYEVTFHLVRPQPAFIALLASGGDRSDLQTVYGPSIAATIVQILKQCGDELTRENVMRQAAGLHELPLPMLLPGITINTSPSDFQAIKQVQMKRFDGERFVSFGPVLSAAAG